MSHSVPAGSLWQGRLVRLRAVQPSDWGTFHGWDQDTDAARQSYFIPFPRSPEGTRRWIEETALRAPEGDAFRFAIETLAGDLVGTLNTTACNARRGICRAAKGQIAMTTSTVTIPAGYALRRPTRDDIPAIIQLIHDFDVAVVGEADTFTPDDILSDWRRGNPDADAWIVEAPTAGRIAAYATVIDQGFGRIGADAYVHPDHWGRGIGTLLVWLTEDRAHELMPNAPAEAQVTLANGISLKDEAARRLLESSGYTLARSYSLMRIAMDAPPQGSLSPQGHRDPPAIGTRPANASGLEPNGGRQAKRLAGYPGSPPAPEWPDGITLRTFVPRQDERAVFACVEDSFADHWGHVPRQFDEWIARTEREDFDPTLWFLAFDGDQLAGVCLCLTRPDDGWVNTLGVRRPWRQRGLGMALLRLAFGAFYQRGVHTVGLMVDAQSLTGATRLYERAGVAVIAQFGLYKKELRPGVDLSTQALAEQD